MNEIKYSFLDFVGLDDHAWVSGQVARYFVEVLAGARNVKHSFVDSHLPLVEGIFSISAGRLSAGHPQGFGGHASRA